MTRDNADGSSRILASYAAILLGFSLFALSLLPRELAVVLASWFTLSISAGITIGHCVLNEP